MNNQFGKVYLFDWPTGSGKTLGVYRRILGNASSINVVRKAMDSTAVFIPAWGMRQAWIRDLGIYLLDHNFELHSNLYNCILNKNQKDDWRSFSGIKSEKILNEIECLPTFYTFRDLKRRIRIPTNNGICRHLVVDEWHRLGIRFKQELQKENQGKYKSRWWNLVENKIRGIRDIFLCSATPLNPVNESKREESDEISEDIENNLLKDELLRSSNVIAVFSGHETSVRVKLWRELESKEIILEDVPRSQSTRWKPPILPTGEKINLANNLKPLLMKARQLEVAQIKNSIDKYLPYTTEFRYCQSIIKTHANGKKHYISGKKNYSFSIPYSKVFDPKKEAVAELLDGPRKAESWILLQNGRILRLVALLEHFNIVVTQKSKTTNVPLKISSTGKKVVIFCTHQATAKGLYYALKNLLPNDQHDCIATSFMKSGNKKRKRQINDIIRRFNRDDDLRILIATDAFSESYDLHEKCKTIIHYELPWSPHRLFQRVGRVTRIIADKKSGKLFCNEAEVAHVVIPGSVEEEQIARLKRRIALLAEHHLLPGISDKDRRDQTSAFYRYLGVGPGWEAQLSK